jgi:isopentenyl phosphate kinase
LKIGGSVITDKSRELSIRMEVISRIANEISEAQPKNLVIIHGGGSFGHPIAQKYSIKEGFKSQAQMIGFAETHHIMTVLNGLFMDALVWRGIPAISITPSSCMLTKNGRITCFNEAPLKRLLEMGFIPVLYGDVVLDTEMGFTILSGDQIAAFLALKLNAEKIIIGVDVDGLYDRDPKISPRAKMFEHLKLNELIEIQGKLGGSNVCDVTGGMSNKIAELIPALDQGIPVLIMNASKPGYVYKALRGEKVKGTFIERE